MIELGKFKRISFDARNPNFDASHFVKKPKHESMLFSRNFSGGYCYSGIFRLAISESARVLEPRLQNLRRQGIVFMEFPEKLRPGAKIPMLGCQLSGNSRDLALRYIISLELSALGRGFSGNS